MAITLTAVAGWVDGVGFLQLGHLFVSFMSGNSTQAAVALAQGRWADGVETAGLVALFVMGAFAGHLVASGAGDLRRPAVLSVEAVLLVVATVFGTAHNDVAHAVAAAAMTMAMGLQNALHPVRIPTVGLTYATGTLAHLGEALAQRAAGQQAPWLTYLLMWLGLVTGAVGGAASYAWAGMFALVVPLGVAALLAVGLGALVRRDPPWRSPS